MANKKTKKADPKTVVPKPHIRGNMIKDRVTGNWSRIPDKQTPVKEPESDADASPPQ